jgi:hypothetical protein
MKTVAENNEATKLLALASESVNRAKHAPVTEAGHLLLDAINQIQTAYCAIQDSYAADVCAQLRRVGGM